MDVIFYEKQGDVGVVTMAKPPHNLIDEPLLEGIIDAFRRSVDEGCRSILFRSSMRHFCAGADVAAFSGTLKSSTQAGLEEMLRGLEDVEIPTVAAVHGAALGGGFELALMCDFIIAADNASIGMPEVSLGLLPLLGGVQRVVARAGPARAKEMAMLGRRHNPQTLERWGIVNVVTTEAELPEASLSWAKQLAAGATVAITGIKSLANLAARLGTKGADAGQTAVSDAMWASADSKRGLEAFLVTGPGSAIFEGR